ncbi:MAG: FAD-dependent oxidoreductase, partial [Geminicoccaceae bacterium]
MKRDPGRLAEPLYDLLVVGGGIHGVCIARDAALRGLRVALVERADFGNGTSHNSFKLIHGGLRYLQHLDFRRVRESLRERRFWLRLAPHLVRPLRFVVPTYGHGTRGPEALRLALELHDLIGWDRNRSMAREQRVPSGEVISRKRCLELIPGVRAQGLTGGAIWYDGQLLDADRVLLDCLLDAVAAGADVANYVAVEEFQGGDAQVNGVRARDVLDGARLEVRAKITVLACGPWTGSLLRKLHASPEPPAALVKGMNLVTSPVLGNYAVGVVSGQTSDAVIGRTSRLFFITPWYDRAVIGTSHVPYRGDPDDCRFSREDVETFLAEINAVYPPAGLRLDDVRYCYGGLTPAEGDSAGGEPSRARRAQILDHEATHGVAGLVSVTGIKYTTARLLAERTVDLALKKLGRKPVPSRAGQAPLAATRGYQNREALERAVASDLGGTAEADARDMLVRYGSAYRHLLEAGRRAGEDLSSYVLRCCCLHGAREEMAVRLGDLIFLRTNLAARGLLTEERLQSCA